MPNLFRYPTWTYKCEDNRCVKRRAYLAHQSDEDNQVSEHMAQYNQSLITCKMTCGEKANLWPYPTGTVNLSDTTFNFLPVSHRLHMHTCSIGLNHFLLL